MSQHTTTVNASDIFSLIVLSSLGILLISFSTLPFHLSLVGKLETTSQDQTRAGWKQLRSRQSSSNPFLTKLLIPLP